jgi:hypothetical protein
VIAEALTLDDVAVGVWQRRSKRDPMALHLFDGHYSCQTHPPGEVGPPGRKLVLVSHCERAVWCSHWPYAGMTLDGLDAYRNCVFRNLGAGLSSDLIQEGMRLTVDAWGEPPADGWVTWIDTRYVKSPHPGYCYKQAGWWLDRDYEHKYLVRLRA